uniref:DUF2924 domain-containing protein n=1 Tax=Globodera pallida TaxID=36090 RepID=A0A183C431_GLOPA
MNSDDDNKMASAQQQFEAILASFSGDAEQRAQFIDWLRRRVPCQNGAAVKHSNLARKQLGRIAKRLRELSKKHFRAGHTIGERVNLQSEPAKMIYTWNGVLKSGNNLFVTEGGKLHPFITLTSRGTVFPESYLLLQSCMALELCPKNLCQ